jgi:rifampin ADP-ribosylating transferase
VPGFGSNFEDGRTSNNIYFSATLDAATWGAELAKGEGRGRIYIVEPTGPFEDDPNLTNKRFAGNPTKSYRTPHALRIVDEVADWVGHAPEVLQAMCDNLAELERKGLATIED